jgi:hypothetical protein
MDVGGVELHATLNIVIKFAEGGNKTNGFLAGLSC